MSRIRRPKGQSPAFYQSASMKRKTNPLQTAADRGVESTLLGIFVNPGLALIKCSAGLLGDSFALVADGLESITDVLSGLVVYFGLKIAVKPASAHYPYGHGKAEPIAAAVVSLTLTTGAFAIIYGGVRELSAPTATPAPYTLVVLAGVLIIKELMYRHVASVGDSIGSAAVKSDAWRHRSDALTSGFVSLAFQSHCWEGLDGRRLTDGQLWRLHW